MALYRSPVLASLYFLTRLDSLLKTRCLRWYGRVCRNDSWLRDCTRLVAPGAARQRPGLKLSDDIYIQYMLYNVDPLNRLVWRNALKTAVSTSNPWTLKKKKQRYHVQFSFDNQCAFLQKN